MTTIADRLQTVKARIVDAARQCGRDPNTIRLLAASKTNPPASLREAWEAGQTVFGENYLQEGLVKVRALADLPIEWHFIGPIQSNKTKLIAENFAWVHGIDREKIANRLSAARPDTLPPLQVCVQVNVSGEVTKSGVDPEKAVALAAYVSELPRLQLRGLMAVPELTVVTALQQEQFQQLREIFEQLRQKGFNLDTLSMGMSEDMENAVAEGATMVRIGTAIFGPRRYAIPEELGSRQ
ncbi:MAG: YggS family pyridoxal phosphate-dependent enzyme [Nitrosomonas sp.]|nr:YggS family pyridoxal phosphate-dependent enzyme [Nitrosomonas sp.]